MNQPAVRVRGVSKRYGTTTAVKDLDLEIPSGEVFGLLGPNGSGKTTTILMLLGLTEPDRGDISVLGLDPRRRPLSVKRQVGYLPDAVGFYDELTGRENLRYTARLNGMRANVAQGRINDLLARIGLSSAADRIVGGYSRGMRQRLGLADLLLKEPRLAIMDEPTLGLDPQAADEFLELIAGLKADGVTVILSSHLLRQVQSVCDRVGLFAAGQMRLVGTLEALSEKVIGGRWRIVAGFDNGAHAERFVAAAQAVAGVGVAERQDRVVTLFADRDLRQDLLAMALAERIGLCELYRQSVELDEVYAGFYSRGVAGG